MSDHAPLQVYYDAGCPICRRERRRYERLAHGVDSVQWIDVTSHEDRLRECGVEPQQALLSLHVEDAEGVLHRGIDAYILLMQRAPILRPLAVLMGLPVIKPLLSWWYGHWVKRRLIRQGRL